MKEVQVHFIRHRRASDVVVAYMRLEHPRMKIKNLLKQKTEFELKFNDILHYPGTVKELIKTVRKLGVWGFCDKISLGKENPIINYWISKGALKDKIKIMELFGHEITHAIGISSEIVAIRGGAIAGFSYMSMMEELDETETSNN